MKGLWKYLIPFSPDTSGFASVISCTDGLGLFDDIRGCAGNFLMTEDAAGLRPPRVYVTEIADEDIIAGTEPVILERFQELSEDLDPAPSFVMLCSCPVSSLTGADLKGAASKAEALSGIPAGAVDFSGYGNYDTGIRKTLAALGRLLCEETGEKRPTVNILGANYLDWTASDMENLADFCRTAGLEVQSVWGGVSTAEQYRKSPEATLNWVVSAAGTDAAKWMEKTFGIPYIAGAPFGESVSRALLEALKKAIHPDTCIPAGQELPASLEESGEDRISERGGKNAEDGDAPQALIIAEQFTANAIRDTLMRDFGFSSVQAAGFFTMEKQYMQSGDRKLKEENDLMELLRSTPAGIVIGDPMLNICPDCKGRWVPLPHIPVSTKFENDGRPPLLGTALNEWLRESLS